MTQHAPSPWWTETLEFATVIRDRNGRRIAEVFRDFQQPATETATARVVKLAPVMLCDLKMVRACLQKTTGHHELIAYLSRTIAAAEEQKGELTCT